MTRLIGAALVVIVAANLLAPQAASGAVISYWSGFMTGANEFPANNSQGTGVAFVDYDNVAHTMRVRADWSGLTGNTTNAHIHAPTPDPFDITDTAGVATTTPTFTGFPSGATFGTYDHTFDLTQASSWNPSFVTANGGTPASAEAAFFGFMDSGRAYFNIHSTFASGGEIRGFMRVPEPGALALLGAAGMFATIRRRRAA